MASHKIKSKKENGGKKDKLHGFLSVAKKPISLHNDYPQVFRR